MVLATFTLDPAATDPLTDNEHVDAINAASNQITRASSVSAVARPLETDEVTATEILDGTVGATELAVSAARDNLKAQSDTTREFILTRPVSGEFPVVAAHRTSGGLLEVEYDDEPIV